MATLYRSNNEFFLQASASGHKSDKQEIKKRKNINIEHPHMENTQCMRLEERTDDQLIRKSHIRGQARI